MAIILAVEDDIFILQSLEWVIEDMGHNALLASDLAGALCTLRARTISTPCSLISVSMHWRSAF